MPYAGVPSMRGTRKFLNPPIANDASEKDYEKKLEIKNMSYNYIDNYCIKYLIIIN